VEREALALSAERVKLPAVKQVQRCRNYVLLHLRKQAIKSWKALRLAAKVSMKQFSKPWRVLANAAMK
jgi:hypothetical protein